MSRSLVVAAGHALSSVAPGPSLWIERVTEPLAEVADVDAIATASFTEGGFSIDDELARPWSRVWIARADGSIGGFLIAWHVADELHVLNVATAPPLRRRGIASALMRAALDYAKQSRVRIVLLEVRRSNRAALRLYRTFAFSAMGIRPNYYSDDGEDAVEMILGLDPETGRELPGQDEVHLDL